MTAVVICGSCVRPIARTGPKEVSVMEDVFDTGIAIGRRRRRAPGAWPASGPPSRAGARSAAPLFEPPGRGRRWQEVYRLVPGTPGLIRSINAVIRRPVRRSPPAGFTGAGVVSLREGRLGDAAVSTA